MRVQWANIYVYRDKILYMDTRKQRKEHFARTLPLRALFQTWSQLLAIGAVGKFVPFSKPLYLLL